MDTRVSKLKSLSERYRSAHHEAEIQNQFCRIKGPALLSREYQKFIAAGRKEREILAAWNRAYEIAVQAGCNIPTDCIPHPNN